MITPKMLARINELARKKRETGLTETELAEQSQLRRLYIDNIKGQVKAHLETIKIVDEPADQTAHSANCSCGCHHQH